MALPVQRLRPIITTLAVSSISAGLLYTYLGRNLHADTGAPRKVFGKGPAFISLPLESSEAVNHNTKLLRFKLPHPDDISGLSLTSSVLTLSWPQDSWLPIARPYTPISPLSEPGTLDLLVKHYPHGKQSTHLHSLQPGSTLLFAAALKGPQWKPNCVPHATLIAGGAGITPIYQLARGILRNPEDRTGVTLVYGVNTDEDVLLQREFEELGKEFGERFKVVCTVSRPGEGSLWRKGHVTKELLEEVVGTGGRGGEMVFVCGPPAMEDKLLGTRREEGVLAMLGYRKEQIHRF